MSVIGLIPAFDEEAHIYDAVRSLFDAGCGRVVVLDGAYRMPDGKSFMGGGVASGDETQDEAESAGALVVTPKQLPRFGEKRDMLIRLAEAENGDHLLFLDADERAVGELAAARFLPSGHACVTLRNVKPNDLPGIRGEWPRGDAGPVVPLLRFLRWSPGLRFVGIGKFEDEGGLVEPYLVQRMVGIADRIDDPVIRQAAAALRENEQHLEPRFASALPVLEGVEILHIGEQPRERIEAKRALYTGVAT